MKNLLCNENAIVEVTKEVTFDSAHFLEEYVGKCSNMHGHQFRLHVTLRGTLDSKGMVIDFKDLKKVINEEIVDKLDHTVLNDKLKFNPTAENMVVFIFEVLTESLPVEVITVKLWETPTSYAEFRGDYNVTV